MTKRELIQYMDEKRKEGYITHPIMLELYDDDEEVPREFISLMCHRPEKPRRQSMIMGQELSRFFNQAMEDYWLNLQQQDIKEKTVKNFKLIKN